PRPPCRLGERRRPERRLQAGGYPDGGAFSIAAVARSITTRVTMMTRVRLIVLLLVLTAALAPARHLFRGQPGRADDLHRRSGADGLQGRRLPLHGPRRRRLPVVRDERLAMLLFQRHGQLDRSRLAAVDLVLQLVPR